MLGRPSGLGVGGRHMMRGWLTDEFGDLFARNPGLRVILWFDAKEEFARLLDSGAFPPAGAGFRVLRYGLDAKAKRYHGPLWLKAQIVWETRSLPAEEREALRFVLHLPFSRDVLDESTPQAAALESLLEYRYVGRVWLIDGKEPSLFQFLRKHGVPLPSAQKEQRALWEGGRDSLLAKVVTQYATADCAFWKLPLDAAQANQLVVGPFEDHLFAVLSDPDNAVAYLVENDLLAEFLRQVEDEFGYAASITHDPRGWVQGFTVRLAMTECFLGYGQPDDFPFLSLVPEAGKRPRWLAFWKRWTGDRDLAAVYNRLIEQVEGSYNLAAWAKGRAGSSEAFAHLARARWEEELAAAQAIATSRSELEEYASGKCCVVKEAAGGYWARATEELPGWSLMAELCALVQQARDALSESEALTTPQEFVSAYTARWHQIDTSYWRIFQGVRRSVGLEKLLDAANLCYRHYLEEINGRFVERVSAWSDWTGWGPQGVLGSASELWQSKVRTAVVVVDALRFDLAAALSRQVRGAQTSLTAWVGSIPSITPVGMASLMPQQGDPVKAVLSSGRLELVHETFGDLSVKERRRQMLMERTGATCMEMADLLSASQLPATKRLAVFTNEIDGLGHQTGAEMAKYLEQQLSDLRLAIEKLHRCGFENVHVVADHGFILLSDGYEKSAAPGKQTVLKGDRYAFLADGAVTDLLTMPFPLDPAQRLAFPPGIACFGTAPEYIHGGLSLQEVVVPHLKTWVTVKSEKIGVECVLPATETGTLTVKVVLVIKRPATDDLLAQPQGRTVEVTFTKDGQPVAEPKAVTLDPGEPEDTRSVTVFLDDTVDFAKGDVLSLQVRDTETYEDFAGGKTVTLLRDMRG